MFLKRSQSILLPLHLMRSFFFLTCYVELCVDWIFWQEFRSPRLSFADWMGVIFQSCQHFGSKFVFVEIPENVVYFTSEADVAALTCNCSGIFFFKRYFLTQQLFSSWTLRTPLALYIFFFLCQFFFVAASIALHKSPFFWR